MKPFTHGGNQRQLAALACRPANEILDFSANINPLGPPEWLRPLIASQIASLAHYPDPDCTELILEAGVRYGLPTTELLAANGTEEILCHFPAIIHKPRAIIPMPSYVDYARTAEAAGQTVVPVLLNEKEDFRLDILQLESHLRGDEVVYLGHPNNPTGRCLDVEAVRELIRRQPDTFFVIDEAFADFVEGISRFVGDRFPNVLVLLSLTKMFAVPGLRIGCVAGNAQIITQLKAVLPTWNVNTFAQAVGTAALKDTAFVLATRRFVETQRSFLLAELAIISDIHVYLGDANFLLIRIVSGKLTAIEVAERLLVQGIAIRTCGDFGGLDNRFFRIAVRSAEENARLVEELQKVFGHRVGGKVKKRQATTIMFQGTSSNAGKSVLTTALCRILQQDGFRVAPFKSQNMSLNSFVSRDGGEMGRAQVVQAQACRIEPDPRMNPILLKPNSVTGSQVILMGKSVGNMNVDKYIQFKPQAFEVAKQAFDSLAEEQDVVVIEGAGSPGEVNLKSHDIVNMAMARYAAAPVLLVGDIDRGGVYASFVGTMEVLAEWERKLVAGFVVNRFRGQESLLADAHDYVLRHTGVPVLGVLPYLSDLGLPEEDSVSFKASHSEESGQQADAVEIAILDLPHISNFTDFDALRIEPDVVVRIVRHLEELGTPDAIILPGSKNVATDLAYLRINGLAERILALAQQGETEIVGICGGYQMLGNRIDDPHQVESSGASITGLGLLPLHTVMAAEKTLERVTGKHLLSGLSITGYEIHHGQSFLTGDAWMVNEAGEAIGCGKDLVWGSYLHGVFDADAFRRWFIDRLRVRRGQPAIGRVIATYDLQAALDRLAAMARERLDMKKIYQLLQIKK